MATIDHARHCFDTLAAHLNGHELPTYAGTDVHDEYPLFITWNTIRRDGSTRLRGCIGSFAPLQLSQGLQEYALVSALKDRRFSPITLAELSRLECCVSLLTDFEDVADPFDWTIGEHGIHIHFEGPPSIPFTPQTVDTPASAESTASPSETDDTGANSTSLRNKLTSLSTATKKKMHQSRSGRTLSATYLPEVAESQGWDKVETLDSAMRKAGYNGKITDAVRQSVRVTRYRSSKISLQYAEWQEMTGQSWTCDFDHSVACR